MLQRFLCAILLLGYVASQMAALPHAHASQPPGHSSRPHLHSGWFMGLAHEARVHHHRHSHDAGEHGHQHSPSRHDFELPSNVAFAAEPGHDEDAVYVADAVQLGKVRAHTNLTTQLEKSATTVIAPVVTPTEGQLFLWLPETAFPHRPGGCALYLTLRTLRI